MRSRNWMLAVAVAFPVVVAHAESSLDGHPAVTQYLSNDAPFVVFGVTPTTLMSTSASLTLTFMATDTLEQVNVFPFMRRSPGAVALLQPHVPCGPRPAGSWDCRIPMADLLHDIHGNDGEFGLRIEVHGDPRQRSQHSTVIITLPVRRIPASATIR